MKLPRKFINTIKSLNNGQASIWLESFPELITYITEHYRLLGVKLVNNLSFHVLLHGYSDLYNSFVVIKLAPPFLGLLKEKTVLDYFSQSLKAPVVKILDFDKLRNILVLEALQPGTSLKKLFLSHEDNRAVEIAANLIKHLHSRCFIGSSEQYSSLSQYIDFLSSFKHVNIDNSLVGCAYKYAYELVQTQDSLYLLHGDLHHENILYDAQAGYKIIDPKGVVGELAYELCPFIINPFELLSKRFDIMSIIIKRIEIFSYLLNLKKERITQWAFIHAILATCWSLEDNMLNKEFYTIAQSFYSYLKAKSF